MQRTIKTGKLYRSFDLDRSAIDKEARTVPLSFSSETEVARYFGTEVLDHGPKSVRMDRLRSGGPLLLNHDIDTQIGVVESASIADRKGQAVVRFSNSSKGQEIFQDVIDGIRKNVSVGYRIHEIVLEKSGDSGEVYRAMDWEPLEISIVSVPADVTVGVGRGERNTEEYTTIVRGETKMEKEQKEGSVIEIESARKEAREAAQKAEHTRVTEILAIGEKFSCQELAREFVKNSKSVEDFRAAVLERKFDAKPIETPSAELGMSKKERGEYSILRAIRQIVEKGHLDGLEKEASDATGKLVKREAKGFFLPQDILLDKRSMDFNRAQMAATLLTRVMQTADSSKGGYTVGSQVMASDMIELLRNKTLITQLGARHMGGLVGNLLLPRITGGATAFWLSESGAVTASDQAFGQLALIPKRLVGDTAYTKELLFQSSIDVENFVREDLMRVLAIEKDRAAINGAGSNGEPLGILNHTGIGSVTFGGAATWAKVVDFETQVANANADVGSMAYLTTPATRGKWKTAPKITGYPIFLWENGSAPGSGMVNGYRAEATKQVPSDKVLFGNFNDFIMADWAGIDVVVDPYSLKKNGQIEITITLWTDNGARHAGSFTVSTDSGAQ